MAIQRYLCIWLERAQAVLAMTDTKRTPTWEPSSPWDSHPDYPVEDWRYEVANDDTRRGYVDWVNAQIETGDD